MIDCCQVREALELPLEVRDGRQSKAGGVSAALAVTSLQHLQDMPAGTGQSSHSSRAALSQPEKRGNVKTVTKTETAGEPLLLLSSFKLMLLYQEQQPGAQQVPHSAAAAVLTVKKAKAGLVPAVSESLPL